MDNVKKTKVDLDAVKTFYDPHPGFLGAAVPIPSAVKQVTDGLNGQTMTLREAVDKIKNAACRTFLPGQRRKVIVAEGAILLKVKVTGLYQAHLRQVIKYREPLTF